MSLCARSATDLLEDVIADFGELRHPCWSNESSHNEKPIVLPRAQPLVLVAGHR
jgi:hypothetical protein